MPSLDKGDDAQRAVAHYLNTIAHVRVRQQADEENRYQAIVLPKQKL